MRRWLPRILICLILGVVTTVVIAWSHAAFVDGLPVAQLHEGEPGVSHRDFPRWEVVLSRQRGSTVIQRMPVKETTPVAPVPLRDDPNPGSVDLWVRQKLAYDRGLPPSKDVQQQRPHVEIPDWSRAANPPGERYFGSDLHTSTYIEDARGWPLPALVSYHDGTLGGAPAAAASRSWQLNLGGRQGPIGLQRGLPLKPIAPGFIVDTLMFAAMAFLLIALPIGVRARMRRGRGCCPMCAYDLRGGQGSPAGSRASPVGCPECGWNRRDVQPPGEAGG